MVAFLEEWRSTASLSLEIMEAVKPSVWLEVTSRVTSLRKKVLILPLAQLAGVVIETDSTSCTLT